MSKRLRVLLAVSFGISAAIALTVWLLGFDGAANAIGLLTAAIGLGSAMLGWLVPGANSPDSHPVVGGARATADADSVGTDPARRALPRPGAPPDPPPRTSAGRARRWTLVAAASLAPILVVGGAILLVRQLDAGRPTNRDAALDGTGSSPMPSPGLNGTMPSAVASGSAGPTAPGTPGPADPTGRITPVVDPPPPPSPTRRANDGTRTPRPGDSVRDGQPWDPPAGTPEWTLHDTDGVRFLPRPTHLARVGSADLTFQANMHQINWYQWTDSDDLSYEGCRNPSATRWDGLKLDLFTTPRTYCRREPQDPGTVSYVQFTAKDMDANPPYVKVRVWVHSP